MTTAIEVRELTKRYAGTLVVRVLEDAGVEAKTAAVRAIPSATTWGPRSRRATRAAAMGPESHACHAKQLLITGPTTILDGYPS